MRQDRGFALLIVLWLLVPVSIMLLLLSGTARSDSQLTANLRDAAVLQAAADGGIETAIFTLLRPGASLEPLRTEINGARVSVQMTVLSGLINPNIVTPELLRAVLMRLGTGAQQAERLTAAIIDWRTPTQEAQGKQGNLHVAQYQAAGLDYGPPGAPFESVGELRLVLGMTPEIFAALRPYLTLYTERPPDPALAPPPIHEALHDIGAAQAGADTLPTVFAITAEASRPGRGLVTRQATVKLGFSANQRPWRILAWGAGPGG